MGVTVILISGFCSLKAAMIGSQLDASANPPTLKDQRLSSTAPLELPPVSAAAGAQPQSHTGGEQERKRFLHVHCSSSSFSINFSFQDISSVV